jgi:hypothetical protein
MDHDTRTVSDMIISLISLYEACKNEVHSVSVRGSGLEVIKIVSMGTEAGIPLMHQPVWVPSTNNS